MDVYPVEAFEDNYIWVMTVSGSRDCIVVDPGDEEPVLQYLQQNDLDLKAIFLTHKHYDHTGGVNGLKQVFPAAVVFGPGNEGIKQVETVVAEGMSIELSPLPEFKVLEVPGHTEGHVAYLAEDCLFCGDTMFAGGCGRVFTGTFEQLSASLQKISSLNPHTKIYCAHEYTRANLGFAAWVEPGNAQLANWRERVEKLRKQNHPTVPTTLQLELEVNPFLRTGHTDVIAAAEHWAREKLPGSTAVFTALRQWKDRDYD